MKLGEKIKALRRERGMTQARLAGERITRNMLCEIEKGKASPSLDTLHYLAGALGVPAAFLLDESEDAAGYYRREALPRIRTLYRAGEYAECIRLCEGLPGDPDDELNLILAHCAVSEGKRAFRTGNMETALVYFNDAAAYAQKTAYPTEGLMATVTLYTALADNVVAPRRKFDEEGYLILSDAAVESELCAYMNDDLHYPYKNELYAAHIKARELLLARRFREALPLLTALEDQKGDTRASAYFLFRLYSDLEISYREERAFELAYKYAAKRMNLLSAFQS